MRFRERLADLISGGHLTRETERADFCRDMAHNALDKYTAAQERNGRNMSRLSRARAALRAIDSCETPKANATVRKMAALARKALE